jgi:outer membrane receptor protein involved in Fe transport
MIERLQRIRQMIIQNNWQKLAAGVLVSCLLTIVGLAQQPARLQPGSITGQVTDKQGGAIKTAQVTLVAKDQNSRSTTTDDDGKFAFDSAPSGDYELRVTAAGFNNYAQGFSLSSDPGEKSEVVVNVMMEPARIAESMIVTAARAEIRLIDAPASVSVLDANDVSNAAAQTVDDLLRQVPGFSIFRRSSSIVANPTTQGVSLRGAGASGASRTLVLTDGVPLNDAFGGWVYWDRVPRAGIDRIELVRGGSSDLYGSDALSGVINVISRPPSQTFINAEARYGMRDTRDLSFYLSQRL